MVHVAALTEGDEVRARIVRGVVIAVRGRQHDFRRADDTEILYRRQGSERSALPIAPRTDTDIPPAPIAEMVDGLPMRPTTALTGTTSAAKADCRRELRPIDGVEEAVLAPDRHRSWRPVIRGSSDKFDRGADGLW